MEAAIISGWICQRWPELLGPFHQKMSDSSDDMNVKSHLLACRDNKMFRSLFWDVKLAMLRHVTFANSPNEMT